MEKEVTKTIVACDFCERDEECWSKCLGCGKDACYECQHDKEKGTLYPHAVYCSGTSDGFYCKQCDGMAGDDNLLLSYRKIQELRRESQTINHDFEQRRKITEAQIERLRMGRL